MRRTKQNAAAAANDEAWLQGFWDLCVEVGTPPSQKTFDADVRFVARRLTRKRLSQIQHELEPLARMLPDHIQPREGRPLVSPEAARTVVAALHPLMIFVLARKMFARRMEQRGGGLAEVFSPKKTSLDAHVGPIAGELRVKVDRHGALSVVERLEPATALCRLVADVIVGRAELYRVCRNPACSIVFFRVGRQDWCGVKCRDRFRKANERRPNRKRLDRAPPIKRLTDDEIIEGVVRRP